MNYIVNLRDLAQFDLHSFQKFIQEKEKNAPIRFIPASFIEQSCKIRKFREFVGKEYHVSFDIKEIGQYRVNAFGEFIRERRKKYGFNIRGLAPLLGISIAQLGDIENGKKHAPIANVEVMKKFIQELIVTQEEIKAFSLMAISSHVVIKKAPLDSNQNMNDYVKHFQFSPEDMITFCLTAISSQGDYPFLYHRDMILDLRGASIFGRYDFGELIRKKREEQYISLRQFAQLLGISAAYLSEMECGDSGAPLTNLPLMEKLLKYLLVSDGEMTKFYLTSMTSQKWDFGFLQKSFLRMK